MSMCTFSYVEPKCKIIYTYVSLYIYMLIYVLVGYKAKRGIVMREDKMIRKLWEREVVECL